MLLFKAILPIPPSVNACYVNARRGRFKSARYKAWLKLARNELIGKRYDIISQPVVAKYSFAFADKRRRDVANFEKALSDFLVANRVLEDDSLILENTQVRLPSSGGYVICELYAAAGSVRTLP